MRNIKCILFFLTIFGTWNLQAQDQTMERLAAERFNHFNVVFYSFLNNIYFLEEDANEVFSTDQMIDFTTHYYGDLKSFENKMNEMQSAFERISNGKAAVVTVQVCRESLQDLFALGLLEKPKGQPCQKTYQQEYYNCVMEHIVCSKGELSERLSALYDCTFSRTQDLHDCLDK
jgi:hypothetical protein